MTATQTIPDQLRSSDVLERLTKQAFNRSTSYLDHQDAVHGHHLVRSEWLDAMVSELADTSAGDLLTELRHAGLLWSVVATAVGVTDTAVRKWRKGQAIEPRHRQRLARLVALSRLHATYAHSANQTAFGEWLDRRIVPEFSATPLQLLALCRNADSSRLQPLLDWMLEHDDGEASEALLDRYLGDAWRRDAREEQRFRIVTNRAGERVVLVDE